MIIINYLNQKLREYVSENLSILDFNIEIVKTKKEFEGLYTIVLFQLIPKIKKSTQEISNEIVDFINNENPIIKSFNVIQGFLNLDFNSKYLIDTLININPLDSFESKSELKLIEFCSPNTNKPFHLGHIRNILLGDSVSKIFSSCGYDVHKTQIINDRGIHICKSMIAWRLFGNGSTPKSEKIKGDKYVGNYYTMFDKIQKEQIKKLIDSGHDKESAAENTDIMKTAKIELTKWEDNDTDTRKIWEMMNNWVYEGFDMTYKLLGVSFDKNYYESETYLLGKDIILEGLRKKILYKKEDSSIWIDLENEGLDKKLLIRSDGTSVYMTQDLGTAVQRISDNLNVKGMIYTVGNEQDYHFKVLIQILKRLGYKWADNLHHLSYGMVDLPTGKMKSREGTVVDADDLIYDLIDTVKETTEKLEKYQSSKKFLDYEEYKKIALGALKYFILKVDPKKNILFNPEESIDLTGNTGPFIQYAYVRIQSILKKAKIKTDVNINYKLNEKEKEVIKIIHEFPTVIENSYKELSPALISNYLYDLVKSYNSLYQNHNILNSESKNSTSVRLLISLKTSHLIESCCDLLGIELPNKM